MQAKKTVQTAKDLRYKYPYPVNKFQRFGPPNNVLEPWITKKEAAAYTKAMSDPKSPQAVAHRYEVARVQAMQAKLWPDTKVKPVPPLSKGKAGTTSSPTIKH